MWRLLSLLSTLASLVLVKADEARFKSILSKSLTTPSLKLNDALFAELTDQPREFSSVVLLTALPAQFGCQLCRDMQPEFDILAKSWITGDKEGRSKVFFGTLDFPDGKTTFQKLMLQTAPVMMLFPPTIGPGAAQNGQPVRLDFSQSPQTAEQLHSWVGNHLPKGPRPPIQRPFNYLRLATLTTLLLGGISFITITGPFLLPLIQNRNLWAAICLITILLFTSGHMFNHIRKVAYVTGDGKGGITYFAGGFVNQFGMETQIIAAMYGILSFATIALALKAPRISDARQQQVAVIAWVAVMFGMYSFLLRVFKIKNAGYPFHLPPF